MRWIISFSLRLRALGRTAAAVLLAFSVAQLRNASLDIGLPFFFPVLPGSEDGGARPVEH